MVRFLLLTAFSSLSLFFAPSIAAQSNAAQDASSESTDYLRPGDVIRVRAIGDPEIVGEFTVDETGRVTLPKLGERKVTETGPIELKKQLLAAYSEFLRYAPEIVFFRRIMVWGAVNKPGLYPVDPTLTIANVLVLAGGASWEGKADKVQLIRDNKVVNGDLRPETLVAQASLRSGDQLFVPRKNWLARNTGVAFGLVSIAFTLFSLVR